MKSRTMRIAASVVAAALGGFGLHCNAILGVEKGRLVEDASDDLGSQDVSQVGDGSLDVDASMDSPVDTDSKSDVTETGFESGQDAAQEQAGDAPPDTCSNDCQLGAAGCLGDAVRSCEMSTSGCTLWGSPTSCPTSAPFCSNGACQAGCQDECTPSGKRECAGKDFRICGSFDTDTCLEWGPLVQCATGEMCRPVDTACVAECNGVPCYCAAGETQSCTDVGECKIGVRNCESGQFGACVWQTGPSAEVCDGKDNDCNGMTDDALPVVACMKQLGVCFGSAKVCGGAAGWLECTDGDYAAHATSKSKLYEAVEAACDGQDNDCDGQTDEPVGCCQPSCAGKACAQDDGCGNPCQQGTCTKANSVCTAGVCSCVSLPCDALCCPSSQVCFGAACCTPDCSAKACGASDGCGGTCKSGACQANAICVSGQCQCSAGVACLAACCASGQVCNAGACCTPDCTGRVCGADPSCGQSCGTCLSSQSCDATGQCVSPLSWKIVQTNPAYGLMAISGTSATNIWAVGTDGQVMHYNGTQWSGGSTSVGTTFFGIWAGSGVATLAGSNRYMKDWVPSVWSPSPGVSVTPGETLYGVWGSSPSARVAVGKTGQILSYNGASWTLFTVPLTPFLYGVWGTAADNVWVVGEYIVHQAGVGWYTDTFSPTAYLQAVWGTSASDVWAVGWGGYAARYAGSAWAHSTTTGVVDLNGIWGSAPNDYWAVGVGGKIVHYDGSAWKTVTSPVTTTLKGIWGASPTDIWAVGANGTILRYN